MGNVYSAQNVASYLIYKLNESNEFVNCMSIQHILAIVETRWQLAFGHTAFKEIVYANEDYIVKEVLDTYAGYEENHIELPATEYYLKYGTFQLVERTYAVPNFTYFEEKVMQAALAQYRYEHLIKVS